LRDVVYTIDRDTGIFRKRAVDGCAKVDGHVHSEYSNMIIPTQITKLMGVRESYTSIKKVKNVLDKRGMTLYTAADHDSILGALEMRRMYPEKSFINCEYTVNIEPTREQIIHVGCWGLDYANDAKKPLSDSEVYELHEELRNYRQHGYLRFIEFCREMKIGFVLNHALWDGNPKRPLSGRQLDELTDAFPVIEINGDFQIENLIALEIARDKKKVICAGSDAHTSKRIGKQFTSTMYPASTPYGFMQAFLKGDVGIGSIFSSPEVGEIPDMVEVIRNEFNGDVKDLQSDIYQGIINYYIKDWGGRKIANVAGLIGFPFLLSQVIFPELTVPFALLLEGLVFASIPVVMARVEKTSIEHRTRTLYKDYKEHLFLKDTEAQRSELSKLNEQLDSLKKKYSSELPKMMKDPTGWDKLVYTLLHPFRVFHAEYGLSSVLNPFFEKKY